MKTHAEVAKKRKPKTALPQSQTQAITDEGHAYTRDLKAAIQTDAQLAAQTVEAAAQPCEWKIVPLRECPTPDDERRCDTPDRAAAYWRKHITTHPFYNPECECAAVLLLDVRRQVKGHCLIAVGTLAEVLVHPREVFRAAVIASAAAIIFMHNHPSGDPTPSQADIKVSRELYRAGQLLKIDLLDSIVVGAATHYPLRRILDGTRSLEQIEIARKESSDAFAELAKSIYYKLTPKQQASARARFYREYGTVDKWPAEAQFIALAAAA